ncbi:MAG: hypothetical protein V1859_01340 [archaeon]
MKKSILLPVVFLLTLTFASAFMSDVKLQSGNSTINIIAMSLLFIETVFVLAISANLIKFINITKRNKAFVFVYATICLFLFNSVINIFYFVATLASWSIDYSYLYAIERLIMVITFVMITVGFLKFNKLLRTR